MPVGIFLDVFPTGEARRVHRKHAVLVVGFWRRRHDTVGGKHDRTIECAELFFLFPPRVAVVSNQMLILFQFGIIVSGQHFAVGVHVNARSFGLFQQVFDVVQVVSRNQNARVLAHADVHFGYFGVAIRCGVGLI